jgi:hypothetical protein
MWLSSRPVSTLEDTEDDRTYMTLGRIIDMRVDPALEDNLLFPSDVMQAQPNLPYLEVFRLCVWLL